MGKYKSWGVHFTNDIDYAGNFRCQECDWPGSSACWHKTDKHIIGFSKDFNPTDSMQKFGKLIIKCPRCHEKFWFHINGYVADSLIDEGLWKGDQ
jgi:hypothetical protein